MKIFIYYLNEHKKRWDENNGAQSCGLNAKFNFTSLVSPNAGQKFPELPKWNGEAEKERKRMKKNEKE